MHCQKSEFANSEDFDADMLGISIYLFFDKSVHKVILGQTYLNTNNPMKPHFVYLLAVITLPAFSQNKTLGVGTTTNNPNAALHVESPTNNQGFLMPRLSSVQRNAIPLATPDAGLMVYDNVINKPYFWDGASWQPAAGLAFPFAATDGSATSSFSITNTAGGFASTFLNSGTGSAAQFTNSNVASTSSTLTALNFGNGNSIEADNTVYVVHNGMRGAGDFRTTNASSSATTLNVQNFGGGYTFHTQSMGTSSALSAYNSDPTNTSTVIWGVHDGLGPVATFQITNALNASPAIDITHSGTGNAITANAPIEATAFIGDGSQLTNLPATESGWSLGGNSGTTAGTDFIGTTDANELVFKANNVEVMRIYTSGQIGIGDVPVSAKLAVGSTTNTIGVHASLNTSTGGQNRGLSAHVAGNSAQNYGVYGTGEVTGTSSGAIGVYGDVVGTGSQDAVGVMGVTNNFLITSGTAYGLFGSSSGSSTTNWAGYFDQGDVHITNSLSVGTPGTFGSSGQVLTSQGAGTAPIWANSAGWNLSGNTGSGSEFIGTTNDQPLTFRVNNQTAGQVSESTSANTFLGYQSGLNHTGTQTTAVGFRALFSNSTGAGNTAVGFETIFSGTTSNWNTAVGWHALSINGSGNANTGVGYNANATNASGSNNTAIGYGALSSNTSGDNTAVGYNALLANTTGSGNTALGHNANVGSSNLTNATAIGANALVNTNNTIMLGSTGTYVTVGGSVPQAMVTANHNGTADPAATFGITNPSNSDAAIYAATSGAGHAVEFANLNAGNGNSVVSISNSGTGPSLFATGEVIANKYSVNANNPSSNVDIIQGGTGSAGTFQIANVGNGTASLVATTNGTGSGVVVNVTNGTNTQPGIEINYSGTGIGLSMNGGSLKYSTATISATGTITVKAGVYRITGPAGSYTLPSAIEGETCLVFNNTAGGLSGDLTNVASGTVRQFVFIAGAWRIVN
jgi:hypothetical protein